MHPHQVLSTSFLKQLPDGFTSLHLCSSRPAATISHLNHCSNPEMTSLLPFLPPVIHVSYNRFVHLMPIQKIIPLPCLKTCDGFPGKCQPLATRAFHDLPQVFTPASSDYLSMPCLLCPYSYLLLSFNFSNSPGASILFHLPGIFSVLCILASCYLTATSSWLS